MQTGLLHENNSLFHLDSADESRARMFHTQMNNAQFGCEPAHNDIVTGTQSESPGKPESCDLDASKLLSEREQARLSLVESTKLF